MNKFDMSEGKTYYDILEIPITAKSKEIYEGYSKTKNAYSKDSLALYSLMSDEEGDEIRESIENAYSILSDTTKKKEYDLAKGIDRQRSLLADFNGLHENAQNDPNNNNNSNSNSNEITATTTPVITETEPFNIGHKEALVSRISAHKRFHLEYQVDMEFEQFIENQTNFTGELLQKIRNYKGLSIERLSDLTKISKTYIIHLESENIDKLPAMAYIRGFIYQYAKCLKLLPDLVATSYISNIKEKKKK